MMKLARFPYRPEVAAELLAVNFNDLLAGDNNALRIGAVLNLFVADDFGFHFVSFLINRSLDRRKTITQS